MSTGVFDGVFTGHKSYSPLNIPGCRSFYDFSKLGLGADAGIASVTDLGPLGATPAQATGTKQPLYKDAILNTRPLARFDGTDDFLQSGTFTAIAQPYVIMILARTSSTAATRNLLTGSTGEISISISTTNFMMNAGANLNGPVAVNTNYNIWTCTFNGTSSILRINGGAGNTGNAGTNTPTRFTIGSNAAGTGTFWIGDLAKLAVFNRIPTNQELNHLGYGWSKEYQTSWAVVS